MFRMTVFETVPTPLHDGLLNKRLASGQPGRDREDRPASLGMTTARGISLHAVLGMIGATTVIQDGVMSGDTGGGWRRARGCMTTTSVAAGGTVAHTQAQAHAGQSIARMRQETRDRKKRHT